MFRLQIKGKEIILETESTLFSPGAADRGTVKMLEHISFSPDDIVLDLGCGYGLVGICAASQIAPEQVFMTDIDPIAVAAAARNLKRNGIEGVTLTQGDAYEALNRSGFTLIISNPPYHTDFAVAKTFIEKGFNRLVPGGRIYMVTRRKTWYLNKLISIFGGVRVWEEDGYYIFMSQKNSGTYAGGKRKKRIEKQV